MFSPESLDLTALPSVALSDRRLLPSTPCIYFAIDSQGTVQYIGRSINPAQRWVAHHRKSQLKAMGMVRIAYLLVDADLLIDVEMALIKWFNPPLNGGSGTSSHCNIKILLKEIRTKQGFSQKRLAESIGMSLQNVQRIEYGDAKGIQLDTLDSLCKALNCKPGDLLVQVPDDQASVEPIAPKQLPLQQKQTESSQKSATRSSPRRKQSILSTLDSGRESA